MPGVGAVLTADDVKELGDLPCCSILKSTRSPDLPIRFWQGRSPPCRRFHCLRGRRYHRSGRDAIEAIEVNWTPLPAVVGLVNAVKNGAPQVWPKHEGNILSTVPIGDKKATDAVFAKAHAVAEVTIAIRASSPISWNARCGAEYDAKRDHLTLTIGSQGSHRLREIIGGMVLKMPLEKMRVICSRRRRRVRHKTVSVPRNALISVAAKKLKKTIKWTADRGPTISWRCAGPRQRHHRADGAGRRRQIPRMDVDLMGDMAPISRPSVPTSAWRRRHAAGPLRYQDLPLPRPHRVHQHRAGRRLSVAPGARKPPT